MDVDFDTEKMAVFEQAWAGQRDQYYNPKYNGVDWNEIRAMYTPLVEGAQTPDELRRLLRMMVGELNSSHSGVSARRLEEGGRGAVTGQLGLSFDRDTYEKTGQAENHGGRPAFARGACEDQGRRGAAGGRRRRRSDRA